MATFRRVEDIEAWQKARELTKMIYSVSGQGEFSRDFGLKDQIRRASVSIMSNLAEGFERDGNREFLQHLSIAKGSLGELRTQLIIALDQRYLSNEMSQELQNLSADTGRILAGLMIYLRKSGMKGLKFK